MEGSEALSKPENSDEKLTKKLSCKDISESPPRILKEQEGDRTEYPGLFRLSLIVLALTLSLFLVGLDNTILSTAIPKITDQFHALGDVGWYASSYLLTTCAFQLMWGKLYTFYPIKWTYLTALFIFEIGSLICGVAPSSTALIVGRAIAGVGSGGLSSGAFLTVAHSVPPRQRSTLIGLVGGMYGFAAIAGPLMGGAFTDNPKLTWRWCFYINLPFGLLVAVIIFFFIPTVGTDTAGRVSFKDQIKQMDLLGTACMLPGVICLVLALQWGGTKYQWNNGRIITLLVIATVLLTCFVLAQIHSGERATVPVRVFLNRNIWGSALFGAGIVSSFFVMLYYIPIWFQAIKEASAIKSGVMNLPMVLSFVLFSFLGGTLTSVIGHYVQFVYLTVVFMAIGSGLLTTLEVDSGHPEWIGYQFIFGAGVGFGLQSALTAAQTALPLNDIPIGTAIIMFSENLASAIMVSVAQNTFTNQLVINLSESVPSLDPNMILDAGATQIKNIVPRESYRVVLVAYNRSLTHTFYVCVGLSCAAILGVVWLEWLSVKGDKKETKYQSTK
ncbi:hypothetical protein FQN57_006061 [Myotisia sp. PD_48]|nr:hypothetical protein FQN57_006061 [Myotisia sp. PD_48]